MLRPRDVPAAAQALGIPQPDRTPTAANIRDLHRPWTVAQALDFLRIASGRAAAGPALEQWPVADFGAGWYHDITREKVLDLEPDPTYPVCVTGAGDFPIEYWSEEDEDQQPVPFD